jgi:anaerobic selenocysteine-containing dehydrogenase
MKRVGKRGENKWQRISWDEAYDTIEEKFKAIKEEYGPESIIFCQGTGRDIGGALTLLAYSVGSPNWIQLGLSGHSCYSPRLAAMWLTMNEYAVLDASQWLERRYDDPEYKVPKYIVIWGIALPNTCPDGFFNHWIVDLMKRGSKLIVIDPRVTWLASRSEVHLRLRSGTDGALALGMLNVIINEGLYDREFVEKWTNAPFLVNTDTEKLLRASEVKKDGNHDDFVVWDRNRKEITVWSSRDQTFIDVNVEPAFEGYYDVPLIDGSTVRCRTVWTNLIERVAAYSPEKVADICWLEKEDVIKAARLFAQNDPSAIHWGVALDHVGPSAVPTSRAITQLFCITGNLDRPGGNAIARYAYDVLVYPFRGEALHGLAPPPPDVFYNKRSGAWKYPIIRNWRAWGLSDTVIPQMFTGEPYPIKAAWLQTCNPIAGQSPEPKKLLEGMKRVDFVVVVDAFMTPTAVACADMVLPVCTFIERWGLRAWWTPLQAIVKVVEPREETKSDYEINLELAKRFNPKLPWNDVKEMFEDLIKPAGVTYDDLCQKVWMLPPKGHP